MLRSHGRDILTVAVRVASSLSWLRNNLLPQLLQGRKRILLYTERAHFYFRYRVGGVKASSRASIVDALCEPVMECRAQRHYLPGRL